MLTKTESPHAVERRKLSRKDVMWVATLATSGAEAECVVLNISKNGAMIRLVDTFEAAASAILSVPSYIVMDRSNDIRCDTMWRNDDLLGVQFQDS
jgi:hypothetical protein